MAKVQKMFDIMAQDSYSKELSSEYTEKLECKDCGYVHFRPAEIHQLKASIDSAESFYATVIQKFICPKCSSENFISSLVKGKIQNEEDNIISAVM